MEKEPDTGSERKPAASQAWLAQLIGPQEPKTIEEQPQFDEFTLPLPPEALQQDGARLIDLEIRGLPESVEVVGAQRISGNGWRIDASGVDASKIVGIRIRIPSAVTPSFPITMTIRSGFLDGDSTAPWYEMCGTEITSFEFPSSSKRELKPAQTTAPSKPASHSPAVMIDLDVSIGVDDPAILENVAVEFSDLPNGAWLTAGALNTDGTWIVPATLLTDLAVVIPEEVREFDLEISLDLGDGEPQNATVRVENDSAPTPPEDARGFIRLLPGGSSEPTRFKVYSDGKLLTDRVIAWGEGPEVPVDLVFPFSPEDAQAYEFLIRCEAVKQGQDAPEARILVVEFGPFVVRPDIPSIGGRGRYDGDTWQWQGDVIIDLQAVFGNAEEEISEAEITVPDSDDFVQDENGKPDDTASLQSDTPAKEDAETTTADDGGVLVINASTSDLRRPGFLDELKQLRAFLQEKSGDRDSLYYGRLGVDVGRWSNLEANGPAGASIDLDPLFPRLAPIGGRDNDRGFHPILVSEHLRRHGATIGLTGLPPGALLSKGINMGGGAWRISSEALLDTQILLPSGDEQTVALRVSLLDGGAPSAAGTFDGSVIVGSGSRIFRTLDPNKSSISLVLEPEIFDENDYGRLSVTVGDVPPGVILARGKNHGQGVWTFDCGSGSRLDFIITSDAAPFTVTVTCVAMQNDTGESTVVTRRVDLDPTTGDVVADTVSAA